MVQKDNFTGQILSVAKRVYASKDVDEDIRLYLLRNDFLPTCGDSRILQVEINTISAGFAGIMESLSQIHASNRIMYYPRLEGELPENKPCFAFASAMAEAVKAHNEKWGRASRLVVFVVESGERNIIDQYAIERYLGRDFGLTVVRRTLEQIYRAGTLSEDRFLLLHGLEVALVYFRSGYDPKHYGSISSLEWKARELIEISKTVKCPTLLAQLAGTKKVQQLWFSNKGSVLSRFGLNPTEIDRLFQVFAVQTDPSRDATSRMQAVNDPDSWVLKPQREGGGNNLYGQELKEALSGSLDPTDLAQFVLMERMNPVPRPALVLDSPLTEQCGTVVPLLLEEAVSELGLFSIYLPHSQNNSVCGHLLRTKDKSVREGGVNAGFAFLDTAALF